MRNRIFPLLFLFILTINCKIAIAQYPSKPINIIVPFPAGTASDLVTRILAGEMSQSMGQPILVQNRPGANGAIGAAAVAATHPTAITYCWPQLEQ